MICGECDSEVESEDYLCIICRMVTDGKNYSVLDGFVCDRCHKRQSRKRTGRMQGYCTPCANFLLEGTNPLETPTVEDYQHIVDDIRGLISDPQVDAYEFLEEVEGLLPTRSSWW